MKLHEQLKALPLAGATIPQDKPATLGAVGAGYRRELYRGLWSQRIWSWGRGDAGTLGFDDDCRPRRRHRRVVQGARGLSRGVEPRKRADADERSSVDDRARAPYVGTRGSPKELKSLRRVPVKQLVGGPHHSAVLDWRGGVYSWGFDACLNVRQTVRCVSDPRAMIGDAPETSPAGPRKGASLARATLRAIARVESDAVSRAPRP